MLQSMTGFGNASIDSEFGKISIDYDRGEISFE